MTKTMVYKINGGEEKRDILNRYTRKGASKHNVRMYWWRMQTGRRDKRNVKQHVHTSTTVKIAPPPWLWPGNLSCHVH